MKPAIYIFLPVILSRVHPQESMSSNAAKPVRRARPNYLYTITGVTGVLTLLGFFGLLLLQGKQLLTQLREQVDIMVEFREGTPAHTVDSLRRVLVYMPYTKPGTTRIITKEMAAQELQGELGEDFAQLGLTNPLFDMVLFNVKAHYMHPDSLMAMRKELLKIQPVHDVYYQESALDQLFGNLSKLSYLALGVGLLFAILAVALIHNTIRLAIYSNRFLIKNMELVGASWEFISYPYLRKSFWHGLLSALLACGLLFGLMYLTQQAYPEWRGLADWLPTGLLFLGLV